MRGVAICLIAEEEEKNARRGHQTTQKKVALKYPDAWKEALAGLRLVDVHGLGGVVKIWKKTAQMAKDGDFDLLFPSWLRDYITENDSKQKRMK